MRTLLIFAAFALLANADVIVMKNGDRVTGSVIKKDATTVTVKSAQFGTVTLPWDQVDSITTDNALNAELVGMSFSFEKGKAFYVPFSENRDEAQILADKFKPFFENESIEKIGQNVKYDLKVLTKYGISIKGKLFDTMIAHYLINPDMRHNMDVLSETYLKYSPKSIEDLIGKKGKNQKSMREIALEEIKEYAAEDADVTYQLKQNFSPILDKAETKKLFDEIEIPLIPVLAAME